MSNQKSVEMAQGGYWHCRWSTVMQRHQEWSHITYWMSEVSPACFPQHHPACVVWLATAIRQYGAWFKSGPLPSFIFKKD